jgi:hypothetical protein
MRTERLVIAESIRVGHFHAHTPMKHGTCISFFWVLASPYRTIPGQKTIGNVAMAICPISG